MIKRRLAVSALLVTFLVLATGGWTAYANSYGFTEQRVRIPVTQAIAAGGSVADAHTGGYLDATLTTPRNSPGRHGLVVFVHGDGPANASRDDGYKPVWEAFSKAGFATLSWDKAGVGAAPGDWLKQSLADRGAEVSAALDWAHSRNGIDASRMGIWAISQGGWVAPAIAAHRPDVRFLVLVGVAVNWLRQGEFNLRAEMRAANESGEQQRAALQRRARNVALFERGASYQDYLEAEVDTVPMSRERYDFVMRNFRADATADISSIGVPTLLLLGGADRNVDVVETARVYAALVPAGLLTEHTFPGATHSLTRDSIEYRPDDIDVIARAVVAPRSIYTPGYLELLTEFARAHGGGQS
ncbi:alpha/beta hydrolase family protein [Mycolicibacterium sp. A43C]